MAMTSGHFQQFQALNQAGDTLDDKVSTFMIAEAAAVAAQATLDAARAALDAAWTDFVAKKGTYVGSMLTPPVGYTPPV